MCFFNRKKINIEDVASVVILEQTQNYTKGVKRGLIFGDSLFDPDFVLMDGEAEPSGCTYTFSITFKDGSKKIIKADSGTSLCDSLLQIAMDGTELMDSSEEKQETKSQSIKGKRALELKKNQLPNGVYKIGEDIPAGTYDFHHVWGSGRIAVYKAEETLLGNLEFSEWVGTEESYEKADCISVECKEGWYLHVKGNIIVDIVKSKKIEIDL